MAHPFAHDIQGQLVRAGVDLGSLSFRQIVSVIYSFLVDSIVSAEVPRVKAMEHVDSIVAEQVTVMELVDFQNKTRRDARNQWGASAAGMIGHANAQAIAGGPAGPPV